MRGVVGWLRPGSRFAFQRQVRQMHRMHRTQGIIFADVVVNWKTQWLIQETNIPWYLCIVITLFYHIVVYISYLQEYWLKIPQL